MGYNIQEEVPKFPSCRGAPPKLVVLELKRSECNTEPVSASGIVQFLQTLWSYRIYEKIQYSVGYVEKWNHSKTEKGNVTQVTFLGVCGSEYFWWVVNIIVVAGNHKLTRCHVVEGQL